MCTVKNQFVLWVAMETIRFHIAQMSKVGMPTQTRISVGSITHLVVQSEQFESHEKLSRGCKIG